MTASVWSPNSKVIPQVNVNGLVKQEAQYVTGAATRSFSIQSFAYVPGTGSLLVYKNGKALTLYEDYFEVDGTTIMLADDAVLDDKIQFFGFIGVSAVATVDAQLRADIAAYTGANIMSWRHSYAGAVTRLVGDGMRDEIFVENFGVIGDDATDNTASLQKAINIIGSQLPFAGNTCAVTLKFRPGKTYYIPGTVYLPSFVVLDGNGANIRGSGANTLFESGYFSAGVVVTNHTQANETQFVVGSQVKNFNFYQINRVFKLFNFCEGSAVTNNRYVGCNQAIYAKRCFYGTFTFNHTRSPLDPNAYAPFHFDDAVNALTLIGNFAVGYQTSWTISGTKDSVTLINCGAEGGSNIGVNILNSTSAIRFVGCYFENVPYAINCDAGGNHENVVIEGCWFNSVTYALNGSTILSGKVAADNKLNGAKIQVSANFSNRLTVEIPTDVSASNTTATVPATHLLGDGVDLDYIKALYNPGTGLITKKGKVLSGAIPRNYSGDVGTDINGVIPFCTVARDAVSLTVTTQIRYRETAKVSAILIMPDDGGQQIVKALAAGGDVLTITKPAGLALTVSNVGGYFSLTVTGLNNPTDQFYGTVELY